MAVSSAPPPQRDALLSILASFFMSSPFCFARSPLSFPVQLSVTLANASTRTKLSRVLVIMTFHWPLAPLFCQSSLNPRHLSLVEREDRFPIVLHVDDHPA